MTARHISPTTTTTKKSNTVLACGSAFFLLVLGNIFFSVQSLQIGFEMGALEREKAQLIKEHTELSEQISKRRSLSDIAEFAKSQGYQPITKTAQIEVASDTSVALR